MKVLDLEVQDFRGIRAAAVTFGPGLTVLHGPNELGKSTLVEAIHAALFLQTTSQAGNEHVAWGRSMPARVRLTFEHDGRLWRVSKRFGYRKHAALETSDTVPPRFREVVEGNGVEGRLREMLQWGIAPPGGRGAPAKAGSFLLTALLGRQGEVQQIFDTSLDDDRDASGRSLVTRAIGALDRDPVVAGIIERLDQRVDAVFTAQGRIKTSAESPLVKLQGHLRTQEERLRTLQEDERKGKVIQGEVVRLQDERQRLLGELACAEATWEAAKAQAERAGLRAKLQGEIEGLRRQLREADRLTAELDSRLEQLEVAKSNLVKLKDLQAAAAAALEDVRRQTQSAAEALARESEAAAQSLRVREADRGRRRAELEASKTEAETRLKDVTATKQAVADMADLERQCADVSAESASAVVAVRQAERALEHAIVRERLDRLNERQEAVTRAAAALVEAQQHEQAARERLRTAAAAVVAAQEHRDRQDAEPRDESITQGESELRLLRAAEVHIELASLRADVQSLERTSARAQTSRAEASAKRAQASGIEQRVARRTLPTREQVAAWRALERELLGSPVRAPIEPFSPFVALAAALAAAFVAAVVAHLALGWSIGAAALAGLVVAVIAGVLIRVVLASRARSQAASCALDARRRDRWTQEVEPSLRAAGLASLAAFEGAVAQVEGLKADANRLRREADEHDAAAANAERAAAPLESCRETLARLQREAPAADAAVSERVEAFGGEADAVRHRVVEIQRDLDAARTRIRDAAAAAVQAAVERRRAMQAQFDAAAREVAVAETTLTLARQQIDPQAMAPLRARLAEIADGAPHAACVDDARTALEKAQARQATAATRVDDLKARLGEARAEAARRLGTLGSNLNDARREVEGVLGSIAAQLAALDSPSGDGSASAMTLEQARNEHGRLAQHLADQQASLDAVTAQRADAERAVADLETGVATRRGQLAAVDRVALEARLERATCDPVLGGADDPLLDPDIARNGLDALQQQLERCTNELNHARGQLHLIAGHVGSERLEQQEEAVRCARAEVLEREQAEQAALRLLREIRQVEAERTTHLGRALGGPITETFRRLAGERYGPIALAPDLKIQHIEASGGPRRLELLSVGVREQLATLLRLAIAGHLKTALVLDDQLVHSDSGRLEWFGERLRASALEHEHQVIVFTCRPGDYLRGGASDDASIVVDLAAVVSR